MTACGRAATLAALLGLALPLGGCGFHPIYASNDGRMSEAAARLAQIQVDIIPNRAGQLLRQALQERFGGDGAAKRYELAVSYGLAADAIGIQPDTSATRLRLVASATWTLRSLDGQRPVVASGVARNMDGLNYIENQYFAADMETEAVQARMAAHLADSIAEQIAVQMAHKAKTASAS